ncbi:hypothetical protein OPKNFCMD_0343 [Methylobacterium crusticola]|uniref:N-acetyltransferase domain-containing protein n=1 Tax=Methylobacterium crusticola TaxID=1697972 RepID=A0ABQ4QS79_9HYPH|nr:GNAT family N-acetyltransferase [Methylobacterium crusticola]GJD47635.1 hypothetical protein OPKNFCMD_0343 [Methylobacterium crusticola]
MTPPRAGFTVAPLGPADAAAVLALNNAHRAETSLLDAQGLRALTAAAFWAAGIAVGGETGAFLIALDQDAAYASPNFLWFRARFRRFVYVDRVVTAPAHRGRGLARSLYGALTGRAAAAGHDRVVCEVNRDPPNPGSDAFHARLGFVEIGSAAIHGGARTVRYLAREGLRDGPVPGPAGDPAR